MCSCCGLRSGRISAQAGQHLWHTPVELEHRPPLANTTAHLRLRQTSVMGTNSTASGCRPAPPAPLPASASNEPAWLPARVAAALRPASEAAALLPAPRPSAPAAFSLGAAAPLSTAAAALAAAAVASVAPHRSGLGSADRPMRPSRLAAAAKEARMDFVPRRPWCTCPGGNEWQQTVRHVKLGKACSSQPCRAISCQASPPWHASKQARKQSIFPCTGRQQRTHLLRLLVRQPLQLPQNALAQHLLLGLFRDCKQGTVTGAPRCYTGGAAPQDALAQHFLLSLLRHCRQGGHSTQGVELCTSCSRQYAHTYTTISRAPLHTC